MFHKRALFNIKIKAPLLSLSLLATLLTDHCVRMKNCCADHVYNTQSKPTELYNTQEKKLPRMEKFVMMKTMKLNLENFSFLSKKFFWHP